MQSRIHNLHRSQRGRCGSLVVVLIVIQLARQLLPERLAAADNTSLNRIDVDLENLGDFVVAQPFDLAQDQGVTESGLDALQRLFDSGACFVIHRDFQRRLVMVRQNLFVRHAVALIVIQAGFMAALAGKPTAMVVRFIDGDSIDPGLQRTLAPETADGAKHLEENFLHDIGRIGGVRHQAIDDVVDRLLEPREQFLVGPIVSGAQPLNQASVG